MPAREVVCTVTEKIWLTPTVIGLRFSPSRRFHYDPGQFLSVLIPGSALERKSRPLRRAYSFSMPAGPEGNELCIKHVQNGPGSSYMASLKVGDQFNAFAPYGDFVFESKPGRSVCFVSTGTGIAPFRAMALCERFRENPPPNVSLVSGVRTEEEIIYRGFFEALGIETIHALSQPSCSWKGFRGRLTDYFRNLPREWGWHSTDFYLCGNGGMVKELRRILQDGHGVPNSSIFQESYFDASKAESMVRPALRLIA